MDRRTFLNTLIAMGVSIAVLVTVIAIAGMYISGDPRLPVLVAGAFVFMTLGFRALLNRVVSDFSLSKNQNT